MNILALDVGTSSVKAAVLEVETGQAVGPMARVGFPLEAPTPDAAEIAPEKLWQAVTRAAREAVMGARVAGTAQDVAGIGFAVFAPGLVLLGKDDQPIAPIWTNLDRRSRPAARHTWAAVGPEFLATTGSCPLPGVMTSLWFRQMMVDDPYIGHRTHSYLHLNGWLGFRLTGERAFDRGNACFTGLFGTLTDQKWSPRWCEYVDVDPAWLPPVIDGSATLGTLRSAVAGELGVPAGIPVKLGSADLGSAMLAAGMKPGDLLHVVGDTQILAAFTESPKPDPRRLTRLLGVGDKYIHITYNPIGSYVVPWIHQLCFRDQSEPEFCEKTIPAALQRETRVCFDPPYLAGDPLKIEACRAAFRDLELTADRMDLLAGVLAAMVRRHHEAIADLGQGDVFKRIFLTGVGTEAIRQLLPDYSAANVILLEEGALHGVARLFNPACLD